MQIRDIPIDKDRREATAHGSFSFPLAVYHTVLSRNALGFVNWHWHEEMQFCLVTGGEVQFFLHGKQYALGPGQGIFIGGGCLHMARGTGGPESAYLCMDVSPKLLASFPGSVFEAKYVAPYLKHPALSDCPLIPEVPWQREILDRLRAVDAAYAAPSFGSEFEIVAGLGRVWVSLLEHRLAEGAGRRIHSRLQANAAVQAILAYIGEHYQEKITVEGIARAVSFSTGECCRLFKRVTGETIFSYLQFYRVMRATELLRNSDLSVSQVAYETGFCSASHFIEAFKARLGMTPLQFKKLP